MRMSSVLALVTVTCTFFCLRAAASGSVLCSAAESPPEREATAEQLVALDAHLDGAEGDFKEIFLDLALHDGNFVHRLDKNLVAGGDVLEQMRLGIGVALIRAGAVGDDGLVEALLKLAAQAGMRRSASFDNFCCPARSSMARTVSRIWNSKSLSSEASLVSSSRVRLRSSTSPSRASFAPPGLARTVLAGGFAVCFELGEFAVQFVEEAGDIHLLRAETLTGGDDDACVEAETLGGLDAGRCAGDAETKLIVGREGQLHPRRRRR